MSSLEVILDCRSGAHCPTCRLVNGGREWRRGIAPFIEPAVTENFDCPLGKPWVADPAVPHPSELAKVAEYNAATRLPVCQSCPNCSSFMLADLPRGPTVFCNKAPECCGAKGTILIAYHECPERRWPPSAPSEY